MKIAILLDPLDSLKTYKDTTFAMMREAASRGHAIFVLEQHELFVRDGQVLATIRQLHLTGDETHWYRLETTQEQALHVFDAVLMRKDPPFDMEYLYATHLLELAQRQGAKVFNHPRALRDYNEKLAILRFAEFTTPTLVTREPEQVRTFLSAHQDIILKPLDGMGGMGIFRLTAADPNLGSILETQMQQGARTIMAQRYIPDIVKGDKRILLIDGEAVPYALARIPKQGETRGNLAAGGRGVAQPLSERDWAIAKALGPTLKAEGLLLVGLDVIGEYLTEVNVTSPTCFQEITQQMGFNVAGMFIDALERAVV
ncbi:glutathione synthase [Chitinivorax tropicus]|uniref:Glutathione synthetase n=1 Tax=Chitinivorax tropicus TaxID=714531 RepID=A0A840MCM7_9PROT|nr:glutathione synthase [Chitinivorax tropicus]MBB5017064.1 glutathione synthase [Chitinivorax tropicus]